MAEYCCEKCRCLFVVECRGLDSLLNKYGDGFTLTVYNGRQILTSCPLCEYYLSDEERYPLFDWAALPVPSKGSLG